MCATWISLALFDLADIIREHTHIHTHIYHVDPCLTLPYGCKWSKILYLTLRFLQRKAALHLRGIHIKMSPAESNCSPAPLISLRWSSCHAARVGVCECGKEEDGERSPEENWPYGMADITSLNKRLMPKAHKGRAEERQGEETGGERKISSTFKMTVIWKIKNSNKIIQCNLVPTSDIELKPLMAKWLINWLQNKLVQRKVGL